MICKEPWICILTWDLLQTKQALHTTHSLQEAVIILPCFKRMMCVQLSRRIMIRYVEYKSSLGIV